MVYIFESNVIKREFCLNCFYFIWENGEKICLIYVNFFEENDVEKIIKQNYDFIFSVIRECMSCNFYIVDFLLSMICVEVKYFEKIEFLFNSCYILFLNKKDR